MSRLLFNSNGPPRFLLTNEDNAMYVCVHCNKKQKHCRCTSPFTIPETLHNFPGQRYNFWADFGIEFPEENVLDKLGIAMGMFSKAMSQAFMLPRELFVTHLPFSTGGAAPDLSIEYHLPPDDGIRPRPPNVTPKAVRKMRLPIYYWSCGHCLELEEDRQGQEPLTVDHPFKMNCCHCGHEYTAAQIINDLAYDTKYEWREV